MSDDHSLHSIRQLESTTESFQSPATTEMEAHDGVSTGSLPEFLITALTNLSLNGTTAEEEAYDVTTGRLSPFPADKALLNIPLVVFLAFVLVVIFVGNAVVLFVYSFRMKSSIFNQFIIALSVVDILSSVIVLPLDLTNVLTGLHVDLCKPITFSATMLSLGTGALLLVIAAVRFLAVYRPMKQAMRPLVARLLILACFLLGAAIAWPIIILTGSADSRAIVDRGPDAWMKVCSDNDPSFLGRTYHFFLFGLFCVTVAVLLAFYAVIGKIMVKQGRQDTIPTPEPLLHKSAMMMKDMSKTKNKRKEDRHELPSKLLSGNGSTALQGKRKRARVPATSSHRAGSKIITKSNTRRDRESSFLRGSIRPMSSMRAEYDSTSDDPFSDENFFDLVEDSGFRTNSNASSCSDLSSTGSAWENAILEHSVDAESGIDQDTSSLLSNPFDHGGDDVEIRDASLAEDNADDTEEETEQASSSGRFPWCSASDLASSRLCSQNTIEETFSFRSRSTSAPPTPMSACLWRGLGKNSSDPLLSSTVLFHQLSHSNCNETEDEGLQMTPISGRSCNRFPAKFGEDLQQNGSYRSSSIAKVSFAVPREKDTGGDVAERRCITRQTVTRRSGSRRSSAKTAPPRTPTYRVSISPLKCNRRRSRPAFRIYRIMILVAVCFICSYVPFLIAKGYRFLFSTGIYTYTDQIVLSLAYRSVYINAMVNPFIYGYQCTNFRKELSSIFRNRFSRALGRG